MAETESLIIEGSNAIYVAGRAEVIEEGHETAWAGPHVNLRPDFGWVLGRYVEANNANENGHVFGLEHLRDAYKTIVNAPLNMLHRAHHVVGCFTAAEMLYPIDGASAMSPAELEAAIEIARSLDPVANPYVEALAAFWRYAFPDEYRAVMDAHRAGACWYSMECVPSELLCPSCPTEAATYAYAGIQSPTYCEHLNTPRAPRHLIEPHFVGGAMIIPPTRPGWKKADIQQVADLIRDDEDRAAQVYEAVAASAPHLNPDQWDFMMAMVLCGALGPVPPTPIVVKETAAGAPPAVTKAYEAHLAKLKMEPGDHPEASRHQYSGGDLWMIKDGWGSWFFASDARGTRWVAQKWEDVMAYQCADELGLTKDDVTKMGMGDQAWIGALTERLGA